MWSAWPWTKRGGSGYPQRECFFCRTTSTILPPYTPDSPLDGSHAGHTDGQTSQLATTSTATISTGTPSNWYCSSCHCQNVATQDGEPVQQYTRPMWDEAWNRDRNQLLRHTRPRALTTPKRTVASTARSIQPSSTPQDGDRFVFCHTCQTNQVLTLNMLADYLPSEDDPGYEAKLAQLPEYEASIATRYPPVCAQCAPRVQQRISERDGYARSWSLGKWLELKKKASNADVAAASQLGSPAKSNTPLRAAALSKGGPTPVEQQHGDPPLRAASLWSATRTSTFAWILFAFITGSTWGVYLLAALHPGAVLRGMDEMCEAGPRGALVVASVGLLLLHCVRVQPLQRSIESAHARNIRVQVHGLGTWRATQRIMLTLRTTVLVLAMWRFGHPHSLISALRRVTATDRDGVVLLRQAAAALLTSEMGLTAYAACQLTVRLPKPLQLVSQPIVATDHQGHSVTDPLLTSLSLDDQPKPNCFAAASTSGSFQDALGDDGVVAVPPVLRDADGDAVMEEVATYSARRRMSSSSDEDMDDVARRPGATWTNVAAKPPRPAAGASSAYGHFQLGPQRFWEPQNPTGLEDVFGRAVSLDDAPERTRQDEARNASARWSQWFGFA